MTDFEFATIQELRKAVDEIDARIVLALRERRLVTAAIRQRRIDHGMQPIDEQRGAIVVDHFEIAAPGSRYVARAIMSFCRKDGETR